MIDRHRGRKEPDQQGQPKLKYILFVTRRAIERVRVSINEAKIGPCLVAVDGKMECLLMRVERDSSGSGKRMI
jgi:hypothetical protein